MIIDGKKIAAKTYDDVKNQITKRGLKLYLKVILVGNNPDSIRYVNQKKKWAEYVGINFELIHMDENIEEKTLLEKIEELNSDEKTTGYLVQMPLPKQINAKKVINAINPLKDVDGFNERNVGKLSIGDKTALKSCTPAGIMQLLEEEKIEVSGKNVVIIGRSNIVGKPLSLMMINAGATVTICNSRTKNIEYYTKNADIVAVAAGVPGMLKKEMIGDETVVIDVGFSVVDGKIFGDADFKAINEAGNRITPVPGGVGPMTVAMIMINLINAYEYQLQENGDC